jgi:diacylglycerol kinase (ATP)
LSVLDLIVGGVQARLMKWRALLGKYSNLNMIVENIWVGGANNPKRVAEQDFDAVLDLREEDDPHYGEYLKENGVEYLNVKVSDRHGASPEILSQIVRWLDEKVGKGEKVLVHCNLGRGRSALVVAAYLVSQGLSPKNALNRIKEKRSVMHMNKQQMQALLDYYEAVSHASSHDS